MVELDARWGEVMFETRACENENSVSCRKNTIFVRNGYKFVSLLTTKLVWHFLCRTNFVLLIAPNVIQNPALKVRFARWGGGADELLMRFGDSSTFWHGRWERFSRSHSRNWNALPNSSATAKEFSTPYTFERKRLWMLSEGGAMLLVP